MRLSEIGPSGKAGVASLFAGFGFHRAHFGSVLVGANPGRVFADRDASPTCAAIAPDDGFLYLACPGDRDAFMDECRRVFAEHPAPGCIEALADDDALERLMPRLFGPLPFFPVPRNVYERPEGADSPAGLPSPGPGIRVDRERAPRSVRVSLADGEGPVAVCRSWIYEGWAEVDIVVEESRRGRGFGTLAGAEFIRYCRELSISPQWSCWADNDASNRLALRLGFVFVREAIVHIHDPAAE